MTSKLIRVNKDNTAAVNQSVHWIPIDENTPRGVKLLLINKAHGIAVLSTYNPAFGWTHYQGLPKFSDAAVPQNKLER